jgi:O-antigen ligase
VTRVLKSPFAFECAAIALSLSIGLETAHGSKKLVVLSLAALALLAALRFPAVPFILSLICVSTITYAYSLPKLGPAYLHEVLLMLGLVAGVAAVGIGGTSGVLIGILLGASGLGVAIGMQATAFHEAANQSRALFAYAAYWPALAAFERDRRRTIQFLGSAAVLVALLSVAQYALGSSHQLFVAGGLEASVLRLEDGVNRVRAPGLMLAYIGLLFAISRVVWGRPTRIGRSIGLAAVFASAIAVSLNRNMLVGALAGLAVALSITPGRSRAASLALLTIATVAALAVVAPKSGIESRFLSLRDVSGLQQTTLADRYYENKLALRAARHHPIFGIGWGPPYGATLSVPGATIDREFVHNQYLELWLRTGLVGVLAMIGLIGATFRIGYRLAQESWIGAAIVASTVAVGLSSIVGTYLLSIGSAVPIAALFAFAEFERRSARSLP